MLIHEACLVQQILDHLQPKSILDCGSSNRAERTVLQPQIAAAFAGFNVHWTDARGDGATTECDFTKRETLAGLPRDCELVTCLSLLEHVEDIDAAVSAIADLAREWLLVSVPLTYPYHAVPIDNGFRPSPLLLYEKFAPHGFECRGMWVSGPENFHGVENASASVVLLKRIEPASQ